MSDRTPESDRAALAEAVRAACLRAALDAYEDGGLQGLCAEGRWELALDALRTVDLGEAFARAGDVPARAPENAPSAPADVPGGADGA